MNRQTQPQTRKRTPVVSMVKTVYQCLPGLARSEFTRGKKAPKIIERWRDESPLFVAALESHTLRRSAESGDAG